MTTERFKRGLKAQIRTLLLFENSGQKEPEEIAELLGIDADINSLQEALDEIVFEDQLVVEDPRDVIEGEWAILESGGWYGYNVACFEEVTA